MTLKNAYNIISIVSSSVLLHVMACHPEQWLEAKCGTTYWLRFQLNPSLPPLKFLTGSWRLNEFQRITDDVVDFVCWLGR